MQTIMMLLRIEMDISVLAKPAFLLLQTWLREELFKFWIHHTPVVAMLANTIKN